MKDKKNLIILILSISLAILIIVFAVFFVSGMLNRSATGFSELSNVELVEAFKENGYYIKITQIDNSTYVNLKNEKEGITIQRIYNKYLGNLMTFDDDSINDEMADIVDTSRNDTPEEKQQYKAYENWMTKYSLTKLQLSNMLDFYYENHKNETEIIDINALLSR